MAEIDFVIMADYVRLDSGILNIVGGGFDQIQASVVPTGQAIGLGMRFLFTRPECGRPHEFRIIFADERAQPLLQVLHTINPEVPPGHEPGTTIGFTVNANLVVPLPDYGVFTFEILLDGVSMKSTRLRVVPPSS